MLPTEDTKQGYRCLLFVVPLFGSFQLKYKIHEKVPRRNKLEEKELVRPNESRMSSTAIN